MRFVARLHVMLKPDVADVQGAAIQQSLRRHGHPVESVKAGKYFEVELEAENEAAARDQMTQLAESTFSNPVIETWWLDLEAAG